MHLAGMRELQTHTEHEAQAHFWIFPSSWLFASLRRHSNIKRDLLSQPISTLFNPSSHSI